MHVCHQVDVKLTSLWSGSLTKVLKGLVVLSAFTLVNSIV